eukprot:TRINITY_DN13996_c0_g1_i3.p1 TRINITY_DN13996_c0_g1~~TRINITY_DN13996_c0_g1_i3.p1  ORF type:complete len:589 (-),score=57.32 TRINITY_DN13996_c0_g1_i3:80-1846(-)
MNATAQQSPARGSCSVCLRFIFLRGLPLVALWVFMWISASIAAFHVPAGQVVSMLSPGSASTAAALGYSGGVQHAGADVAEAMVPRGLAANAAAAAQGEGGKDGSGRQRRVPVVIALAVDQEPKQLHGAIVVINSAISNARHPKRLVFRLIALASELNAVVAYVKSRFPTANIEGVEFDPWLPRVQSLIGGKSSERKELFNPLNFAAFYLHEVFPQAPRVLYLDTDVVVMGEILKDLENLKLDKPVAGAVDCSQRISRYLYWDTMRTSLARVDMPLSLKLSEDDCVINRGVMMIDTKLWSLSNITNGIEALVRVHLSKAGPLWHGGVSQPPFLIAISGRLHDLGRQYNVRGLGRKSMTRDELDYYRSKKLWWPYLDQFLRTCQSGCCRKIPCHIYAPHIVPHTDRAKVVHFNGGLKPARRPRRQKKILKPMAIMTAKERSLYEKRPLCSCGPTCVQECSALWWQYLPPELMDTTTKLPSSGVSDSSRVEIKADVRVERPSPETQGKKSSSTASGAKPVVEVVDERVDAARTDTQAREDEEVASDESEGSDETENEEEDSGEGSQAARGDSDVLLTRPKSTIQVAPRWV